MSSTFNLLTTSELSTLIKRAPETLVRWRRTRIGPPYLVLEGRVLYDENEVKYWLDSRRTHSNPQKARKSAGKVAATTVAPLAAGGFAFSPYTHFESADTETR